MEPIEEKEKADVMEVDDEIEIVEDIDKHEVVGLENEIAPGNKRKRMKLRSPVWQHFDKVRHEGEWKGKCHYCRKYLLCNTKNGISGLKRHVEICPERAENKKMNKGNQMMLKFPIKGENGDGNLSNWRFDYEKIRKALVRMIVCDELPFKFVEAEGFNYFLSVACPRFRIPSRVTIRNDCYQLYLDEKMRLRTYFKRTAQRVCLTTDTWTSLQRINYMCLTAHYIDDDWKLQKKIINFCPISSHKGEAIGMAVENCLLEWGIDKVFTVTVDNASSNDVALVYLKGKMANWGTLIAKGKFLHMRCIAHIINLIVGDGINAISTSISSVRAAVRWVRSSPARLEKFKECKKSEKIENNSLLCLDVQTRWNSTYLMLSAAEKFQGAFDRFALEDPNFVSDLCYNDGPGYPQDSDWKMVKLLTVFLKEFYEFTNRVSGYSYVTSNTFFHEILEIYLVLKEKILSDDSELRDMAVKMKQKYDKYWGDVEKMNILIYVAAAMDPRFKLDGVGYGIKEMHKDATALGKSLAEKVRNATFELYFEYVAIFSPPGQTEMSKGDATVERVSTSEAKLKMAGRLMKRYSEEKCILGQRESSSELESYLNEEVVKYKEDFDILNWWKLNTHRYPILSRMARDVLAVPISTVASESAFSTGGRVLDVFRTSLTPKIAEALLCTQDWLRNSCPNVEEDLAELEELEKNLGKLAMDGIS